jgi:hypothetical protein
VTLHATPTRYHYTCDHRAPEIDRDGFLRPWPDAGARRRHAAALAHWPLPDPLVWLTDLDTPLRDALGLTADTLHCDRTAHRFTVADPAACQPWHRYARRLDPAARHEVETAAPGLLPMHWWVSIGPVSVLVRERVPA